MTKFQRRSIRKLRFMMNNIMVNRNCVMMNNFMVNRYWRRSISRLSITAKMHEGLDNRSRGTMVMNNLIFMVGHRSMRNGIIMMGYRCMGDFIIVMGHLVLMVRNGHMMINMYFMMRCISCRMMNWRRSISWLRMMSMMFNMMVIFVMRIWRRGRRRMWEKCRHVMRHR